MLYKPVALTSMVAIVVQGVAVEGRSPQLNLRSEFTRSTIPSNGASALAKPPGPPNLASQKSTPAQSLPVPSKLMDPRLPSDRLEIPPSR
jgi:hypothetical protein